MILYWLVICFPLTLLGLSLGLLSCLNSLQFFILK
jgi:hypothetical protein